MAPELRMRVPLAEVHGVSIFLRRAYEPELMAKLSAWLKVGDVFIDVGANMGFFTLLGCQLVGPAGKVYAFEPQRESLLWLLRNLGLNNISNAIVISLALSDRNGEGSLSVPPFYNNGVSSLGSHTNGSSKLPVGIVAFNEIPSITDADRARIRLLKIDTEGHELQVLRGMSQLLSSRTPLAIACELSPQWYDVAELVRLTSDYGFCGEYFSDGEWQSLGTEHLPKTQCNAWFERT